MLELEISAIKGFGTATLLWPWAIAREGNTSLLEDKQKNVDVD
jgi:hypothetical protein